MFAKTRINNRKITNLSAAFFSLLLWGGCGGSGSGGSTTAGNADSIRFKELPIKYKIASSIPTEYHSEIHAAFDEWNTATNREVFVFDGIKNLEEDQLSPDFTFDENVVLATNQSGAISSEGAPAAQGQGPLARTYLKGLSTIRDADIYLFEFDLNYLNGRPNTGDVYSVRSVVMHEAGHMLFGEAHSEDPESIMTAQLYPVNHPKEKLGLGTSDIENFFQVYGQ